MCIIFRSLICCSVFHSSVDWMNFVLFFVNNEFSHMNKWANNRQLFMYLWLVSLFFPQLNVDSSVIRSCWSLHDNTYPSRVYMYNVFTMYIWALGTVHAPTPREACDVTWIEIRFSVDTQFSTQSVQLQQIIGIDIFDSLRSWRSCWADINCSWKRPSESICSAQWALRLMKWSRR